MNNNFDVISAMGTSWEMNRPYIPMLVFLSFLTLVLSVVTLGILSGPMFGGLLYVYLKIKDGEEPKPEFLFMPFDRFWTLCVFGLIMECLVLLPAIFGWTFIGFVIFIVVGAYWFYVLPILVTKKDIGVFEAMSESKLLVTSNNYWLHLILFAFLVVVSALGAKAYWLGLLFTTPFVAGTIIACYKALKPAP